MDKLRIPTEFLRTIIEDLDQDPSRTTWEFITYPGEHTILAEKVSGPHSISEPLEGRPGKPYGLPFESIDFRFLSDEDFRHMKPFDETVVSMYREIFDRGEKGVSNKKDSEKE